jgi:putative transcriptional regulator
VYNWKGLVFFLSAFTIKNKVKIVRIEKENLTQGDFAKLVGVTRQTMNLIEAQKYNPTIRVCLLISKYLKTPLDELFWIEE